MYTAEFRQQVLQAYIDGKSIAGLHTEFHVSERTITKWLKQSNIPIRHGNYQALDLDRDEVTRLYVEDGLSTYAIAARLGCSDETIRKLVPVRAPSQRNVLPEASRELLRQASTKLWQNPAYVRRVRAGTSTPEYRAKLRTAGLQNVVHLRSYVQSAAGRLVLANGARACWKRPAYRERQLARLSVRMPELSALAHTALQDPAKRAAWLAKISHNSTRQQASQTHVLSHTQQQFYYLLESSDITYIQESRDTIVGFYAVDCIIPKQQQMSRDLIVEIDGEYWHSLPHVAVRDAQKDTYVKKHTDYDLLRLSEINLCSCAAVRAALAAYGLTIREKSCTTADVVIVPAVESELRYFYANFHYSQSIRRGALSFKAMLGEHITAAISYTYPIRAEVASSLNCKPQEIMEISRIARRPDVSCQNLISYLIGRTRKQLPPSVRMIVSYTDATYGHTGTVYAAAGFLRDRAVADDYHYVSASGRYHKKTVWDRAKKFKMSESEYALKHTLTKVRTGPKQRWVYRF